MPEEYTFTKEEARQYLMEEEASALVATLMSFGLKIVEDLKQTAEENAVLMPPDPVLQTMALHALFNGVFACAATGASPAKFLAAVDAYTDRTKDLHDLIKDFADQKL